LSEGLLLKYDNFMRGVPAGGGRSAVAFGLAVAPVWRKQNMRTSGDR
jgi:hypothetical protein